MNCPDSISVECYRDTDGRVQYVVLGDRGRLTDRLMIEAYDRLIFLEIREAFDAARGRLLELK